MTEAGSGRCEMPINAAKEDKEEVEVTVSSVAAEQINAAAAEIDLIFTSNNKTKKDTESFSQQKR